MSKFFSQHGEDIILERLFPSTNGTCVEVGANDGITFSNSYHFEKKGWKCILIEPTAELCEGIRKVRNAMLFECAASNVEGEAVFHVAEGVELYSSLEKNCTMKNMIASDNLNIKDVTVKTRRLDDILKESNIKNIDFISIDVEGHEISVLHGFTINQWKPRIAIIEDATDLAETPVSDFMKDHGYIRFYRTGGNDWYASPAELRHRSLARLILSRQWGLKGLAKAWLPAFLRRPLTLALRKY
jgi:FkbM family methyltransferase